MNFFGSVMWVWVVSLFVLIGGVRMLVSWCSVFMRWLRLLSFGCVLVLVFLVLVSWCCGWWVLVVIVSMISFM